MISLLMPTRKRPTNVVRLVESALETASNPDDVEFVFYVDSEDQTFPYWKMPSRVKVVIGPRIVLSEMWNFCEGKATGPYYWHGGDDNIFRTPAWDEIVLAAFEPFPDKIAFVHGLDGSPHDYEDFGTHGFIHHNWIDAVGYFVPPYFSSDYNDTWLNEVSKIIGRYVKLPNMLIEHMHPNFNKAEVDTTHLERLKRHSADNVDALYASLADQRIKDAEKLQDFINQWEKS